MSWEYSFIFPSIRCFFVLGLLSAIKSSEYRLTYEKVSLRILGIWSFESVDEWITDDCMCESQRSGLETFK